MDASSLLLKLIADKSWKNKPEKKKSGEFQIFREEHQITEDGLCLQLAVRLNSEKNLVKVFAYPPLLIPEDRSDDAKVLLNELNQTQYSGHFEIIENPTEVRFRNVVDVSCIENEAEILQIINNLIASAEDAFAYSSRIKAFSRLHSSEKIHEIIHVFYNDPESWPPALWGDRVVF